MKCSLFYSEINPATAEAVISICSAAVISAVPSPD